MTSLCHICTACSLHCITFKITEFFFTCYCKSSFLKFIPWMLLIPSMYPGESHFSFGKGQYTLCPTGPLSPATFLTFPNKDWIGYALPLPLLFLLLESQQFTWPLLYFFQGMLPWRPYCSRSAFIIWKKNTNLPCPQKLDQPLALTERWWESGKSSMRNPWA